MTVLVAIPYGGQPHPSELARCVESVLSQTMPDLVCAVLGDGVEVPQLPHDPRLVVMSTAESHGTYFARQVLLLASPFEWHAPVDSDDWIDQAHLEVMFDQLAGTRAALPRQVRGWVKGRGPRVYGAGRYHVGLFGTERAREVGGYAPHERIGQDTLLLRILALTGPVVSVSAPVTYNRNRRQGSLTMARETRHGAPERLAMQERNRGVFHECKRLRFPKAIREYRASVVPSAVADALAVEVKRVSVALAAASLVEEAA